MTRVKIGDKVYRLRNRTSLTDISKRPEWWWKR